MMRRFYVLLLMVILAVTAYSKVFVVDGIKYGTDTWSDHIKGHMLPDLEDGSGFAIVLGLENSSFSGELVIPETVSHDRDVLNVKYIDAHAFENCENLTSVTIGAKVEYIMYRAFYGSLNLSQFNIPTSVTEVGSQAFEGTAWYNGQPDGFVYKDNVLLGRKSLGTADVEGHVDIVDGTRVIGDRVFMYCQRMTSVNIPNTVVFIGESAFFQAGITELTIPNSVTNIFSDAFNYCDGLKKVSLGSSVEVINDNAFHFCTDLISINLPASVKSIGAEAFYGCVSLAEVVSNISEPFPIRNKTFDPTEWNSATLYVPVGTKAKYEATEGWNVFQDIVEMVSLDPIEGETTVTTEGLGNENLTDNVVDDVYYNVGSEGYDAADGSIVISQTTNMGQIGNAVPGSEDVRNNFTGLILKVAAGKGIIKVNVKTTGNAQLVVQVGNGTPMIASQTEQGDVVVGYDVTEDTYVYIYAIIGSSAARATRAASADAVRIYGITVMPGTAGITVTGLSPSATDHYYTTDGRRMEGAPTKKGLYIVNGRKVITK